MIGLGGGGVYWVLKGEFSWEEAGHSRCHLERDISFSGSSFLVPSLTLYFLAATRSAAILPTQLPAACCNALEPAESGCTHQPK